MIPSASGYDTVSYCCTLYSSTLCDSLSAYLPCCPAYRASPLHPPSRPLSGRTAPEYQGLGCWRSFLATMK